MLPFLKLKNFIFVLPCSIFCHSNDQDEGDSDDGVDKDDDDNVVAQIEKIKKGQIYYKTLVSEKTKKKKNVSCCFFCCHCCCCCLIHNSNL